MPSRPTSNPQQFIQQAPVLQVHSVLESTDFYRDILGFNCDYRTEIYGVVWRDNAALHFTHGEATQSDIKHFFWLVDVNAYYAELISKKVTITHGIGDRDYGVRDFGIVDNNGFTLIFGQDIDRACLGMLKLK